MEWGWVGPAVTVPRCASMYHEGGSSRFLRVSNGTRWSSPDPSRAVPATPFIVRTKPRAVLFVMNLLRSSSRIHSPVQGLKHLKTRFFIAQPEGTSEESVEGIEISTPEVMT